MDTHRRNRPWNAGQIHCWESILGFLWHISTSRGLGGIRFAPCRRSTGGAGVAAGKRQDVTSLHLGPRKDAAARRSLKFDTAKMSQHESADAPTVDNDPLFSECPS